MGRRRSSAIEALQNTITAAMQENRNSRQNALPTEIVALETTGKVRKEWITRKDSMTGRSALRPLMPASCLLAHPSLAPACVRLLCGNLSTFPAVCAVMMLEVEMGIADDEDKKDTSSSRSVFWRRGSAAGVGDRKQGKTSDPAAKSRELTDRPDFFMHPNSKFLSLWDPLALCASCFFAFYAPFNASFLVFDEPGIVEIEVLFTALLAIDLIMRFYVGEQSKEVNFLAAGSSESRLTRRGVAVQRLRGAFWIELVGALPLELIARACGSADDVAAALGLLRLAQLPRLIAFTNGLERLTTGSTTWIRVVRALLWACSIAHLFGCLWNMIARFEAAEGVETTWLTEEPTRLHSSRADTYIRSMYWALTTMSGVGYGDITPYTMNETIFAMVVIATGSSFYLFIVGTITSLVASQDQIGAQLREQLASVRSWMVRINMPTHLREKVLDNFHDQFVRHRGLDMRRFLDTLPRFLRNEVSLFLNKDIVLTVPLFRGCSLSLVAQLVMHLQPTRCLPHDQIITKGEVGHEMFLISSGLFEALNDDDSILRCMGPGSYFGELGLLLECSRTMSVRAATHGLLFVLPRVAFESVRRDHPRDVVRMKQTAARRYKEQTTQKFTVGDDLSDNGRKPAIGAPSILPRSMRRGSSHTHMRMPPGMALENKTSMKNLRGAAAAAVVDAVVKPRNLCRGDLAAANEDEVERLKREAEAYEQISPAERASLKRNEALHNALLDQRRNTQGAQGLQQPSKRVSVSIDERLGGPTHARRSCLRNPSIVSNSGVGQRRPSAFEGEDTMANARESHDDSYGTRRCSCISSLGDDPNDEPSFKMTYGDEACVTTSKAAGSTAAAATTATGLGSQAAPMSSAVGDELIQTMRQLLHTQERHFDETEQRLLRIEASIEELKVTPTSFTAAGGDARRQSRKASSHFESRKASSHFVRSLSMARRTTLTRQEDNDVEQTLEGRSEGHRDDLDEANNRRASLTQALSVLAPGLQAPNEGDTLPELPLGRPGVSLLRRPTFSIDEQLVTAQEDQTRDGQTQTFQAPDI